MSTAPTTSGSENARPAGRHEEVLRDLADLYANVMTYEISFARMRSRDKGREQLVGLLVVVFSAIVGSTVFVSLSKSPDTYVKVLVGLLGITAAVLAAINNWAPFTGASDRQRKAEGACTKVSDQLEEQINHLQSRQATAEAAETACDKLRGLYSGVKTGKDTPPVSTRVYGTARTTATDKTKKLTGIDVNVPPAPS